jgi:ribonucleoside-diphosphate reductase alpha chain
MKEYFSNIDKIQYEKRDARITDDQGKLIEELKDTEFPKDWSLNASNTVASKYFRRKDIPKIEKETKLEQLTGRVSKKIAQWGYEQGYLDKNLLDVFVEELKSLTSRQYGSFNSPVWFNLGLDYYGIKQFGEETFYVENNKIKTTKNYYSHPQIAACFILSPEDSIKSMIRVGAEISAKIFKGGSGIGGDWSAVRSAGEPVSGGGYASGAIRFMDVQDTSGRVIKSGGKTRRAATMQTIGIWHPDVPDILKHKYKEEQKAKILIEAGSPSNWESHTIQDLRAQNVNISIRIDDEFWRAYENNSIYKIRRVKDGKVIREVSARDLLEQIAFATHQCGDPGIQNHTLINDWNTCKNSGVIMASNPCSEFMFLNGSACNLASLNLMKYRKKDGNFDLESFYEAINRLIISQDIMVSKSSYPTKEIAWNSHIFRPLGLGYANLGAYIMSLGIPYDSEEARNFAATITANMTAEAYLQSTKLAEKLGTFQEFLKNKESMMEVISMHQKSAKKIPFANGLEELVASANKKWEEVIERGNKHGFRNAQVTLLAPTGTIGFMMDCDTTGCEPVYATKSVKELAGGGFMKIVNKTIPLALEKLNYSSEQINEIIRYINENETIEGAPELKEEHLPVFDCAISSGNGTRFIQPLAHIKMLGTIQPHLSGAISKTINCPTSTSVEEIMELFYQSRKLGVKAAAIYRDGSKSSQPLTSKKEKNIEIILKRGQRESLPDLRKGITQKSKVGGTSLFLRTGEYDNGRLGELFIESFERGSEVNRLLNELAIQFSEKLQYGIPLNEALEIFNKSGQSQISGFTNHPFIKSARGIEGFIYDWISAHYLGDISFVPKNEEIELRPLPWELRVYQKVPKLHLIPSVAGTGFYEGAPTLEETIKKISKTNYWLDEKDGLDTRKTIEKIKKNRKWKFEDIQEEIFSGRMTGKTCSACGSILITDGNCSKCPVCKISSGGCGA